MQSTTCHNHEALSWAEHCGEDDLDLDFLEHLADDEEPCVRLALLYQPESRRPKTLALALQRGNLKELGPWLSEHLDVPPDVLVAGFSHLPDDDDVHVARRADLPLEVIEQLKESGDPQCALYVLNGQNVPVELAEELDEAASTFACMAYARHVGLPSGPAPIARS